MININIHISINIDINLMINININFKSIQVRATERKMSKTRTGRQQRMCNVWYVNKKGNGRQPDNICHLFLIILSNNKACDCYCHLILIDLSKK